MLQAICNKALSLDPNITPDIEALHGKAVAVLCNDYNMSATYLHFENAQLLFSSSMPARVDVSISGCLKDFVSFAILRDPKVLQITGDVHVAAQLQKLFQKLHIDWEEELAQHTGDVFAYYALTYFRKAKEYISQSTHALGSMTVEFLQDEADVLVTQHEIDIFMEEVDALRLRVDRLMARINAYESN